jgi:hypothetical protein
MRGRRSWIGLWIVLVTGAVMVAGCASPVQPQPKKAETGTPPAAAVQPKPAESAVPPAAVRADKIVLEVEAFQLTLAQIKTVEGASGGKAVLFDHASGRAKTTVNLQKGEYEITAFAVAPDTDHDAFYLTGPGLDERIYPEDVEKLSATKPVTMTVQKDGPVALELAPAETDIVVDRLEIKRVK